MFCRNCGTTLPPNSTICSNCGVNAGEGSHFCQTCGNQNNGQDLFCSKCGTPFNTPYHQAPNQGGFQPPPYAAQNSGYNNGYPPPPPPFGMPQKSRIVAGLLGIFVGALGIHNFYLGFNKKGLTQILISILGGIVTCGIATCAVQIWALVEAVQIFMGNVQVDANGIPLKD